MILKELVINVKEIAYVFLKDFLFNQNCALF